MVDGIVWNQSRGEGSEDFNKTFKYILSHAAVPNNIVVPDGLTEDNLRIAKETIEKYPRNGVHEDKDAWLKSIQDFSSFNLFTGCSTGSNAWVCYEVGNQRIIEIL